MPKPKRNPRGPENDAWWRKVVGAAKEKLKQRRVKVGLLCWFCSRPIKTNRFTLTLRQPKHFSGTYNTFFTFKVATNVRYWKTSHVGCMLKNLKRFGLVRSNWTAKDLPTASRP